MIFEFGSRYLEEFLKVSCWLSSYLSLKLSCLAQLLTG